MNQREIAGEDNGPQESDNVKDPAGNVIDEPEFQPELNQVDDDQIKEPPNPKLITPVKFDGRSILIDY